MLAVERAWLWIANIEALRLHYAHTLKAWCDRCAAQEAAITKIHDERFYRM